MGLGQNFLTRVGSGQPFMVWVWIWEISHKNVNFFIFFPSGQTNLFGSGRKVPRSKAGQPLLYCGPIYTEYTLNKSKNFIYYRFAGLQMKEPRQKLKELRRKSLIKGKFFPKNMLWVKFIFLNIPLKNNWKNLVEWIVHISWKWNFGKICMGARVSTKAGWGMESQRGWA